MSASDPLFPSLPFALTLSLRLCIDMHVTSVTCKSRKKERKRFRNTLLVCPVGEETNCFAAATKEPTRLSLSPSFA